MYNTVCSYGAKTKYALNKEKIVDYGSLYVWLWDLADSVRPGAWLSNTVCEIALHVLSKEMAPHKKYVMPLFGDEFIPSLEVPRASTIKM